MTKKSCRDSAFPRRDTAPMFTFVKNYQSVRSPARLNLCDAKKFLRFDSLAAKKFLLLNYSKRKEVLAVRRRQAQASAICRKKLPGLRTQKEVLVHALFLGCTVVFTLSPAQIFKCNEVTSVGSMLDLY